MPVRIKPIKEASNVAKKTLAKVEQNVGFIPNIFNTFAHSEAVLEGYLGLSESLAKCTLSAELREKIALTVAGLNTCDYCASAHTGIGRRLKIDDLELIKNLNAISDDQKTQTLLDFVSAVVLKRAKIEDEDVQKLRDVGFSEAEIVEATAVIGLNMFTNYFNLVMQTEVDFPRVSTENVKLKA